MAEMRKSNKKPEGYKVTVWEMLRDVLVASMNKGQFPLAIVGLIIITIIWRMPSESVGKLAFEVVEEMKNGYLIGYVVAFVAIIGWFFHAKAQRRWAATEIKRVTAERTKVQEEKMGTKLQSSEK